MIFRNPRLNLKEGKINKILAPGRLFRNIKHKGDGRKTISHRSKMPKKKKIEPITILKPTMKIEERNGHH